jgi:hypothetical protein
MNFDNAFESKDIIHKCVLCRQEFKNNKTREHIYPQWLLNSYPKLKSEKLARSVCKFSNTSTSYTKLTVPCCDTCNNVYLSALEDDVKLIITSDKNEYTIEEIKKLTLWLTKIYYERMFADCRRNILPCKILYDNDIYSILYAALYYKQKYYFSENMYFFFLSE